MYVPGASKNTGSAGELINHGSRFGLDTSCLGILITEALT